MPQNGRSPAVDRVNGKASGEFVTAASVTPPQLKSPGDNCKRPSQVRCEACGKLSDKARGRPRRYCSDACRMAAYRARAASDGSAIPLRNGLKSSNGSIGCEAAKRDLPPSRFDIPLDLLGTGHRWPGAPKLDRGMREKILWREGCAPYPANVEQAATDCSASTQPRTPKMKSAKNTHPDI